MSEVASVDGVALHAPGAAPQPGELRRRACTELLRREAQRAGLLADDDAPGSDGVISEAAAVAIEALLEREVRVPDPDEEACRRHYAANPAHFGAGERVLARHVLFAVTQGIDVHALTSRAERMLLELRCKPAPRARAGAAGATDVRDAAGAAACGDRGTHDCGTHDHGAQHAGEGDAQAGSDPFAAAAREFSNCPSGAEGGALGWLRAADCAPEFAREVFGRPEVGVLPRLVRSRFGLHIVEVQAREASATPPWPDVRDSVAQSLRRQSWATALRQYVALLAGKANIEGVELDAAESPLLQ